MKKLYGNQRATAAWEEYDSQRHQPQVYMKTEYQDRFRDPRCYKVFVTTSVPKGTNHPLQGARSFYRTYIPVKYPPKAPQPSLPPKAPQRCSSAPCNPRRSAPNQMASSKEKNFMSMYKSDFQPWKAERRQPFKLVDSLKVNQGLVGLDTSTEGSSELPEPIPIESVTQYKSDFVKHPLKPTKDLLPRTVPSKPEVARDTNQDLSDDAIKLFQQFRRWTIQDMLKDKARESSAAYTVHKCQCTKPVLPSVEKRERSNKTFQVTTAMMEELKAWNKLRRLPRESPNDQLLSSRSQG